MPKLVVRNDVVAPVQTVGSTTVFTKSDGVWVVNEDGTTYGPLGIGLGGPAGGVLAGAYPNPSFAPGAVDSTALGAGSVTGVKIANNAISLVHINPSLIDPVAGLPGLRTLGSGAQQAAAGNDPRLFNARPPTGPASGDLSGTYPAPTVAKLQGYVVDLSIPPSSGDVLTWNGTKWVPLPGSGGGPVGGDLSGSLPNPTVVKIHSYPVSAAAPAPGNALVWNGASYVPTPVGGGSNNLLMSLSGAWQQSGLTVGQAVIGSAITDTATVATNATLSGATPFLGLVFATPTVGTATIAYYGEFPWSGAPLTPGAKYYLGIGGAITTTPPSTPGNVSLRIGFAKSATILMIFPGEPILL